MKRLSVVLAFLLVVPMFSFAQSQTGNASYNPSKAGLAISHPSLSFNTRVKVTNLRNNRAVEAIVNGRINPSPDRIADISRDLGDALGMTQNGMTLVEIEVLHPAASAPAPVSTPEPPVPVPVAETPVPAPEPPAPQTPAPVPAAVSPAPAPRPQEPPPAPPAALAVAPVPEPPVRTVTELQYVPVPTPYPERTCCATPLLLAIMILFLLLVILLVVILVFLIRRFPYWWRWPRSVWFFRHSVWFRRHYRSAKKRRRGK